MKALRSSDAEKAQAAHSEEPFDELYGEGAFVSYRGFIGSEQRFAARLGRGIAAAAEFGDVIDCGENSRDEFLHLRAGFPAFRNHVSGWTDFVGLEFFEHMFFSIERAHVRAKKLV